MPFVINKKKLGKRIEKIYTDKGMTQYQAGETIRKAFNISLQKSDHGDNLVKDITDGSFAYRYFKGITMPKIAHKLAEAFCTDYKYLIGREDAKEDLYAESLKEEAEEEIEEIVQQNIIESKGNTPQWKQISNIALREDLSDEAKITSILYILENIENNNCINNILNCIEEEEK